MKKADLKKSLFQKSALRKRIETIVDSEIWLTSEKENWEAHLEQQTAGEHDKKAGSI